MKKPLPWCFVACFLLMPTSIDFLFAFFIPYLNKRVVYCYSLMFLELIIFYSRSVGRFTELRDALEKLQLNDAALKVALY